MQELKQLRSLNSKHFDKGNGSKVMNAHAGHIHYFDKLDSKRLREISHKLIWDEVKKGWTFKYNSFNPLFPEYSDSFAEFRDLFEDKDQTVKYKAIGKSVKGILIDNDDTNPNFDGNKDNKAVLYKNCFGKNRDYLLYNTRSSMVKVGTVNNPNEQTTDAVFEWEVEFPEKDIFRVEKPIDAEEMTKKDTKSNTEDGKLVGYRLDTSKNKTFSTDKQTLIGNSKLDGKEWFTYLKGYKAWDSEGNTIFIEAKLYNKDGKYLLKKTVPLDFLKNAVGRVFTDTTTSYYAGAGDGYVYNYASTWDASHDASTGLSAILATPATIGVRHRSHPRFYNYRGFFPINTSGIGSGSTITSATMKLYITGTLYEDNDSQAYIGLVQTTQASTATLSTADYNQCGAIDDPTLGSDDTPKLDTLTTSAYNSFDLNATGLAWISKTGYTKLGFREGHDIEDLSILANIDYNNAKPSTSLETGTANDPYLEVTYSTGTGATDDSNFFGCNF